MIVHVVGRDEDSGAEVRFALAHGEDPRAALAARGYPVRRLLGVESEAHPHRVTFTYAVRALPVSAAGAADADGEEAALGPARDTGLVLAEGEVAVPYQRVAAYAVVTSERGALLCQLSSRTNSEGRWALPGGGVDPGESPLDAVHREVWEETGQVVTDVAPLEVLTAHWVGRAPSGRLEDFHAVRVVHQAVCLEPTDPVVHERDGSTGDSAWVAFDDLGAVDLVRWLVPRWRGWFLG